LSRALHGLRVLAAMVCLLFATPALAQTRTIAVYAEGTDPGGVRDAVRKAVGGAADLVDDRAFRAELARAGQGHGFGAELDPRAIDRIRRAGLAIGAEAVVIARERRDGNSRWVVLTVIDVSEGPARVKKAQLDLNSHDKDTDEIAFALGDSLDRYSPQPGSRIRPGAIPAHEAPRAHEPIEANPSASAPSGVTRAAAEAEAAKTGLRPGTTPAQLVATSLLEVAAGIEALGRQFKYNNGISPQPSLYRMFPARSADVSGKIFPFAAARRPWRDIGVAGAYSLTLLQKSDLQGAISSAMPSSHSFGLCARIHPGTDATVLLGACVGYAFTSFGRVGPPNAELPDVTYRSVRSAIDARLAFGSFSLLAAAAFRAMIATDAISARFYGPRGYGLDGEIGGAFMYVRRLEARLVARYERYSFGFTPPPGAAFAAGDALDHLYGVRASLAFVY
jgi:hypothetical protein